MKKFYSSDISRIVTQSLPRIPIGLSRSERINENPRIHPPARLLSSPTHSSPAPSPPLPCQGPRYKTIDRAERRKCVCIYGRETSLPINIPKSGLTTVPHRLRSAEIPRRTADPCHVAIVGDDSVAKKGEREGGREGGISAGPHGLIAPVDLSAAKRWGGRGDGSAKTRDKRRARRRTGWYELATRVSRPRTW